jgi:endonuclease VIII
MPEGPEIFLAARAVHTAVAHQPSTLVLRHPALVRKARSLRGVPIVRVYARSKAMLTEFANGVVLYSHNQLYGEWVLHGIGEPLLGKQVRLIIHTAAHQVVLYSATEFAWLKVGAENTHPYIAKLGSEVLDNNVTARDIAARLTQFPRRIIADALLDQHVIAGLGNYLRADILFVARVNPIRKIADLSAPELLRIANACKTLTRRSVQRQGVVRPWKEYQATRKTGVSYEAARFYTFDREGEACRQCAEPITRVTQGGRGLFYCAYCQRA